MTGEAGRTQNPKGLVYHPQGAGLAPPAAASLRRAGRGRATVTGTPLPRCSEEHGPEARTTQ